MPLRNTVTKSGPVRGVPCGNPMYTVYRGIPYAAPTDGENRFREPKAPQPWETERLCDNFSDICMQSSPVRGLPFGDFFLKEFYPYQYPCSEDSLCLNVWTPAQREDELLPVMFWIHGGGFGSGYGHEMEFDGEAICKEGVILVTINYRLNYFGFFAHPELSGENDRKVSGNYGILDQIAALRWVQENIAAFGGNPDNVTIFGQSAGGMSVIAQLISDLSENLFTRAIIQSGAFGMTADVMMTDMTSAQQWGLDFCEYCGKTVAELRALPAPELTKLFEAAERKLGPAPKTVSDGYVLPAAPLECLQSGQWKNIPIMVGSVRGDYALGANFSQNKKAEAAGIAPEDIAFIGDALVALHQSEPGHIPAYMYYFDPVIPDRDIYGFVEDGVPYHSAELWYIFGTLDRCWRKLDGRHHDLSKKMIKYWTNFAKTGDPNESGLSPWTPFTRDHMSEMYFTEETCHCRPVKNAGVIREIYLDE